MQLNKQFKRLNFSINFQSLLRIVTVKTVISTVFVGHTNAFAFKTIALYVHHSDLPPLLSSSSHPQRPRVLAPGNARENHIFHLARAWPNYINLVVCRIMLWRESLLLSPLLGLCRCDLTPGPVLSAHPADTRRALTAAASPGPECH